MGQNFKYSLSTESREPFVSPKFRPTRGWPLMSITNICYMCTTYRPPKGDKGHDYPRWKNILSSLVPLLKYKYVTRRGERSLG